MEELEHADQLDHQAKAAVVRDVTDTLHEVGLGTATASFTWDYRRTRPGLSKLYEKAKVTQWNGSTDLPWETDVDAERVAAELAPGFNERFRRMVGDRGSPLTRFSDADWTRLAIESQAYNLAQFVHGEQGALVCTGLITATVPWIDAKYYASTQVMDEARHVEVFARYLDEKIGSWYPVSPPLGSLLDTIISDGRWDITYLGMQIMVEGLALAAFGAMHMMTTEPLLKQLLRYVMADEARHVAFGVLSLKEFYESLSAAELRERQEFAFEAARGMRNRYYMQEVWERMGVDPKPILAAMNNRPSKSARMFNAMLFSKIVPNCKKLGLLDPANPWLRERWTELGVIQFEDWVDTGDEYESLQAFTR